MYIYMYVHITLNFDSIDKTTCLRFLSAMATLLLQNTVHVANMTIFFDYVMIEAGCLDVIRVFT
jgi:hypothetical protein